jgi:hypothetical protein
LNRYIDGRCPPSEGMFFVFSVSRPIGLEYRFVTLVRTPICLYRSADTLLCRYIIQKTSRLPGTACYNISHLEARCRLGTDTDAFRYTHLQDPQIAAIPEISQTARESGFDSAQKHLVEVVRVTPKRVFRDS